MSEPFTAPAHFEPMPAQRCVGGKGINESVLSGGWDKDGWGEIDHGRWMMAVAMGDVGTCRKCGKTLIPDAPYLNPDDTYDYEARCSDEWQAWRNKETDTRHVSGCPGMVVARRGRILRASSAYRERSRRLARE